MYKFCTISEVEEDEKTKLAIQPRSTQHHHVSNPYHSVIDVNEAFISICGTLTLFNARLNLGGGAGLFLGSFARL